MPIWILGLRSSPAPARWRHAALIIALALGGCAGVPTERSAPAPETELLAQAERANARGNHDEAAQRYLALAEGASALKRAGYLLEAADALLRGNHIAPAQQILAEIDPRQLGSTQTARAHMLAARIALAQNKPAQALKELQFPLDALPAALRAEARELRAHAYRRSGDLLSTARELVLREPDLTAREFIIANQQSIWQALNSLPENLLRSGAEPASAFTGWRELALIARAAQSGIAIDTMLDQWRARYPAHPASEEIIALVLARQREAVARPVNIAVLLPQSGTVAESGRALRDGFLAAHFRRDNKSYQPSIRFYEAGNDAVAASAAYAAAVSDGADFVVGPLTRPAVNQIASERAPVPTLLLNYSETARAGETQRYQFGLAPEDEARQVAHRAWLDGHNRALALIPDGEWGTRVLQAFRQEWEKLGGTLLEAQPYPADNNDYSEQIKRLLDLDESAQRHAELERLLQRSLQFEPYRRQDADFIFMAAFPRQARLLRPQLKFHYAGELPVYSTSHIYNGRSDPAADRDVDGVIFCDIPWVLAGDTDPVRKDIERLWPDAPGQYLRLYALGADAYDIIPMLNTLRLFPYERFDGHTGTLQLGDDNHVFRQLRWARFSNGVARAYD